MTAATGARWWTSTTWPRAAWLALSAPIEGVPAYWIADAQPYAMTEVLDAVRAAARLEGLAVTPGEMRLPALAGRVAYRLDAALQRTGRYQQEIHVAGELDKTIACSVAGAVRDLGFEPATDLVAGMRRSYPMGAGTRAGRLMRAVVTGGSGYFGNVLCQRLVADGHDVVNFDLSPVDTAGRATGSGGHPRPGRHPGGVRGGGCGVPQRRTGARWPGTLTCSSRSTAAAPPRCSGPRSTPAWARSSTRPRRRSSGCRSPIR